jgi:hypothetical protein
MKTDGTIVARAALFSALVYILALASVYIPNVSLSFIVVFASGALYGLKTGLVVGGLGMFLWTVFNPLGMASAPTTISQIVGMMLVGALGAMLFRSGILNKTTPRGFLIFGHLGLTAGLVYQIVVNVVDAWLYGPFKERLYAGLLFSLFTIVSNALIFPACYPLVVKVARREKRG